MPEAAAAAAVPAKIAIKFELGEKHIDGATIKPPTFASFADCIAVAHTMTTPAAFASRLLRVRLSKQIVYPCERRGCSSDRRRALLQKRPRRLL